MKNNILVTGSSSYIGKNFINFLEKKKLKYIGIDITKPLNSKCLKINILDKNIDKKIKKKIDVIVHLAAISNTSDARKNPSKTYEINVNGTINLLNFARKKKIKKFVFASTEWVYGNFLNKEKISSKSLIDTTKLDNHYSLSKYLCENIIQLNKDIMSVILRFGIIYGNKVSNFSAVEALTKQALDKKQIKIGSLNTSRNFIHVEDIIKGVFKSIFIKQKNNLILDLQGTKSISLGKILNILKKKLKYKINFFQTDKKNASIRKVNYYSSHTRLNFKPEIDIEKGLDKVIKTLKNENKH